MTRILEAELPFDANQNELIISQGFNGPYSHKRFTLRTCQYDMSYALDFALPVGTTVLAVRQGIVRFVIKGNGSCYTGSDPELGRETVAASISIAHPELGGYPNPLNSHYQHLDPGSFLVENGQMVKRGQPLARTGLTGWVGDPPHLHFHFQYHEMKRGQGPLVTSVPFVLKGYQGPLEDAELIRSMTGDSRELVQKILAIRRRDRQL